VQDAEPGDELVVELLSVEPGDWGVTYTYPGEDGGSGLLPETAPQGVVHHWDLTEDSTMFRGCEIPLAPFPGNLGLAPADGPASTVPPRNVGGNLDIRHLVAGSQLHLPVEVAGGLFSIGDGHAAQGDGEVCITAIECPITVDIRFELRNDAPETPWFETPGTTSAWREGPAICTTGLGPDLHAGAKTALAAMLDRLEDRGFERPDAYILCSVACDLQISQIVNAPNWTVTARLPERVLPPT
jgi:acetamidase/formamidase